MKTVKILGYCKGCRSKEMQLFGTVVNTAGPRHDRACEEAKCNHPPYYVLSKEEKGK